MLLIVRLRSLSSRRLTILLVFAALSVILVTPFTTNRNQDPSDIHSFDAYESLRPVLAPLGKESPDPIRWLQENSNDKYAVSRSILPPLPAFGSSVDQSCSEFRTGWYGAEYASTGVEMEQEISSEQILRGGAPISDL